MDNTKMYESPKSVFQQKIKDTITVDSSKDVINDLIRLHLFKNGSKDESLLALVEIYDLLGLEKFTDLVNLLDGRQVKFPKRDDMKDTVRLSICYYYKNLENKSWGDIKDILGDSELPTIKYGIRMRQFQSFLEYMGQRIKGNKSGK